MRPAGVPPMVMSKNTIGLSTLVAVGETGTGTTAPAAAAAGSGPRYSGKTPVAGLFHVLFKGGALLMYFTGEWWTSYITVFVLVVLMCAFDFWVVKNVTGRVMVALRWWNDIKEDGSNEWVFEAGDPNAVDAFDSRFFWTAQMVYTGVWVLFVLTALMGKWSHIPLAGIALTLAFANTIGYIKCSKDAKRQVSDWITKEAVGAVTRNPDWVAQAAMGAVSNAMGGAAPHAGGASSAFPPSHAAAPGPSYPSHTAFPPPAAAASPFSTPFP